MNKLFAFLLACVFVQFSYGQKELSIKEMEDSMARVFAQFSYGQKELSIKEMEDSMAHGNLNIQVDLATEYIVGNKVEQNHAKAYSLIRDAAEKDNRYGQLMLGFCLLRRWHWCRKESKRVVQLVYAFCRAGKRCGTIQDESIL